MGIAGKVDDAIRHEAQSGVGAVERLEEVEREEGVLGPDGSQVVLNITI